MDSTTSPSGIWPPAVRANYYGEFMQVIVEQMNEAKSVIADGLMVLDDAFFGMADRILCEATSDRAVQLYRTGWAIAKRIAKAAWWTIGLMMAAAFFSGVLARRIWDALSDYVVQCEVVDDPVEMEPEVSPVAISEDVAPSVPLLELTTEAVPVVEDVQPKPVKKKVGARKGKKSVQAIAV